MILEFYPNPGPIMEALHRATNKVYLNYILLLYCSFTFKSVIFVLITSPCPYSIIGPSPGPSPSPGRGLGPSPGLGTNFWSRHTVPEVQIKVNTMVNIGLYLNAMKFQP